ncbi:MAG TPA: AbrB family transcriptional regulator [Patescibacteria group bacterium]|nr:AbrB family transcriptional regulator [Patescibacteria group bacterium]
MRKSRIHWAVLLCFSALFTLGLEALRLPAALLLGPMAAAILVAANNVSLRIPRSAFLAAQGVLGCLIGSTATPETVDVMAANWPLFLATIFAAIAASGVLGWLLARWQVLPGMTAVWGSTPGAAAAMTLMAGDYGEDIRLVAFMQYLRVVFVVLVASLVTRFWTADSDGAVVEIIWFPAVAWLPFAETVAIAGFGALAGRLLRIPAGSLLLPAAIGGVLHGSGFLHLELPPWLLAASYALIGWNIGLSFTRAILVHAAQAFPRIVASILTLISICGGLAYLLTRFAGIEPLTAYLATSPGGADSVAIIAASSKVDMPFVMALQSARLIIVVLIGPRLARFIARRLSAR